MSSKVFLEKGGKLIKAGQYADAFELFQRVLSEGDDHDKKLAYLNGGACLRRLEKLDEAIVFLTEGTNKYPEIGGLHHNLGNCLRDKGGASRWLALLSYREAANKGLDSEDRLLSEALLWTDLGYPVQAYSCILSWQSNGASQAIPTRQDLIQLLLELVTRLFDADEADAIAKWCLTRLEGIGENNPINLIAQAVSHARLGNIEDSLDKYGQCLVRINEAGMIIDSQTSQTLINATWNLSCSLLRAGEMGAGWALFEYGLRAPAKYPMRWQRTFPKLFTEEQIPVWRGESIMDKRLLVIGEQAVGDTMMFLRLLPLLLEKGAAITLAVQDRLEPIFTRAYPEVTVVGVDDVTSSSRKKGVDPDLFDFQIPCGSVVQHCMHEWISRQPRIERGLVADQEKSMYFRTEYKGKKNCDLPLIGVSWRGGGKSERIRIKSLPVEDFTELLRSIPARFVSLQYGNVHPQIERWQNMGIDIIDSPEVDALKDMDTWLAQVSVCDLVISVANTTIHGAGSLGIPTLCMLSRNSDWRWVDGMQHSYWYGSVDCTYQSKRGGWSGAAKYAKEWVAMKWPEPRESSRDYSMLSYLGNEGGKKRHA